jgi:O-antigen/teichoic acid export membrane protein
MRRPDGADPDGADRDRDAGRATTIRAWQAIHTVATYTVARLVLGGLTGVVISRTLGPAGRGDYTVLLTIATIAVSAGHLSIEQAHAALWPRVHSRAVFAANSLMLGPIVGSLSALAAATVIVVLGPGVVPVPSLGLLALALVTVPCGVTGRYLDNVLILRARVDWVNWSGLIGAVAQCTACVLLAVVDRLSVAWAVAAWLLCATLPLVVLIHAVRPRPRDRDLLLARRALAMGLRYHLGIVALFLLFRVDALILGALRSNAAVGYYALAVSLAELTRIAADAVGQVTMTRQLDGDHVAAAVLTFKAARLTGLLSLGSAGVMCAVAPLVVPAVFGAAFSGSIGPLIGLVPGMCALGVIRTIGSFLLRLDRPLLMSSTSMAALLVNVLLNLIMIPRFGAVGCAVSASIGYGVLAATQAAWLLRATRMPARLLLPGRDDVRYLCAALGSAWASVRTFAPQRGP